MRTQEWTEESRISLRRPRRLARHDPMKIIKNVPDGAHGIGIAGLEYHLNSQFIPKTVMAALVAAIHFPEAVFFLLGFWKMDGPDKPGHDDSD